MEETDEKKEAAVKEAKLDVDELPEPLPVDEIKAHRDMCDALSAALSKSKPSKS